MDQLTLHPQLVDRAYTALLDEICSGRLAPSERVIQDELALRLAVSRQPILQALRLLKSQGFLCDAGRRGLMVAPLDPAFIANLYELRGALDGLAARGAARHWSASAAVEAAALLAAGRRAVASGETAAMIAADMAFHCLLYRLSGNPLIAETAGLNWHHIRRIMGQVLRDLTRLAAIWDEHAAIVAAIAAGDGERAELLSRRHTGTAAAALVAGLTRSLRPSEQGKRMGGTR